MTATELKMQPHPDDLPSPLLKAMWLAARDDWEGAHNIAQDIETSDGNRIHGYLHWVEGDLPNADYWYRRAGMNRPTTSLDKEWHNITNQLLES
ncbi:MAG: hypothetical protein RIF33_22885 [Cyclobacteriaceae bacterium]